jgi:hypothetical protein
MQIARTMTKYQRLTVHRATACAGPALAGLLFCGCQVLTYTSPSGERLIRSSFGANLSVSTLAIESDATNGVRRVEIHGYQNDSSQALSTITEAAVRGAVQGAK